MTHRLRTHPAVIGVVVEELAEAGDDGLAGCDEPSAVIQVHASAGELYNVYYSRDSWFQTPHRDRAERYIELMEEKHPALIGRAHYWLLDVPTGRVTKLSFTKKVAQDPEPVLA